MLGFPAAMTATTTVSTSLSNVSKHANVHFLQEEGHDVADTEQPKVLSNVTSASDRFFVD